MRDLIDFVALDIETTGFDFVENEIIEIGAVRFVKGEKKDTFSVFIKPKKKVPLFIKQLTHITDEQLSSGTDLDSALADMLAYIKDDILVCHNTSFDIGFLNSKLLSQVRPPLSNRTIDTVELSRMYLPFTFNHKLGTVAEYFGIDLSRAHRAFYDAEATGEILINLLDYIDKNISLQINYRMTEVARYAELEAVFFLEKVIEHQKKNALLTKKKPKIDFHNRNYLEHKVQNPPEISINDVFGEGGLFHKKFDAYEMRHGQIEMAENIQECFGVNEYLVVEAGTGVGKSLAYLIPAIIHANKKESKVIISTNTKNLQEQLFYKDLPTVRDSVGLPFKATLLKGRRNYICEKKWAETTLDFEKQMASYEARSYLNLIIWKEFTKTGDISENTSFNPNRESSVWRKLSADAHFCRGRKCGHYNQCFLMDIRKKAEQSTLVIINHHLLLADLQVENSALGKYEYLVVDEAHNMPNLASSELGLSLAYSDIINFFNQLYSIWNKYQSGVLVGIKTSAIKSRFSSQESLINRIDETIEMIKDNKDVFGDYFRHISDLVKSNGNYGKLRIRNADQYGFIFKELADIIAFWKTFSASVQKIHLIMSGIDKNVFADHERHYDNLERSAQRIGDIYNLLMKMYNPDFTNNAFWLESMQANDSKYPGGILNCAPLNVNQILNETLYSNVNSIIFTSATMAIRGKFKYFSNRMGLDLLEDGYLREKIVESPFDFQKQAKVIVAGFLPEPKDKFFQTQSIGLISQSIEIANTGTMVLFTAYKDLNHAYEQMNEEFYAREIPFMAQGKGVGRSAMLQEFKKKKNAVLFGTNSFWEGIDVPGESLSLLVLYKLPFMVPSEPIVEAYLEKLAAEGKDSFMHYMLPNALLKYRQGFGRLIRKKTDRGIVLVLDNRIATKKYGQYFKETVASPTVVVKSEIEVFDYLGKWFKEI